MPDEYRIKKMTRADLELAIDWAADEGWNPGLSDIEAYLSADPDGFFGGWIGERMIASISVVNHGPDFSFLGLYIVEPSHRGSGRGLALWREAIRHAGDRNIGLEGVIAQQDNYAKSGFRLANRTVRLGGVPSPAGTSGWKAGNAAIAPLREIGPELEEFDRSVFPGLRREFLVRWLSTPGHAALEARKAGKLAGYGVIRPCRIGHRIGPLFATDPATARDIASALVESREGAKGKVYLDVPEPNEAAMRIGRDLGLTAVFETARMYTGSDPDIRLENIYGVSSLELG